jgi:GNAT superfamily N-acetyltransferase
MRAPLAAERQDHGTVDVESMNHAIREATSKDVPVLFDIRLSVRENSATREGLYALGVDEDAVVAAITTQGRGWIAEDEGRVVGFSIADQNEGSVFALFVRPEFEGRGHGGSLLDAAVAWLLTRGFEHLSLAVGPNTRAHGFYLRRGWVETGVVEPNGDIELKLNRP